MSRQGRAVRIGIVGDRDPARATHAATDAALAHAAASLGPALELEWLATERLALHGERELVRCDALFVAPGSPYRSLAGALGAICFAREHGLPLLGTCGGFQHVVLEHVRNVLGMRAAAHAEYDPSAEQACVTPLACSLAGQRGPVLLRPGSRLQAIYGASQVEEEYRCCFGLAPGYRAALESSGLRVAGTDREGEARALERAEHAFFAATLYVPQLSSKPGQPHPLVCAFVAAALEGRNA